MAEVISQNHDLSAINWGSDGDIDSMIRATMEIRSIRTRSASGWDAGEMGISYEDAREAFRRANTPEARLRVAQDLRARALRRADLDVIAGKVAFAGVGSDDWHGLGVRVSEAMNTEEAMRLSGLDRVTMHKEPVLTAVGSETVEVPGVYCIHRTVETEDGEYTSILPRVSVGEDYYVIPIRDCFDYLDNVLGEYGAKYNTVGSVNGGRQIFMSVKMPGVAEPVRGDIVENYTILTNSYDATSSMWVYNSNTRPVCRNTTRQSFNSRTRGIAISHLSNATTRIAEARKALGLVVSGFERWRDIADQMARVAADPAMFANAVLDSVLAVGAISSEEATKGADAIAAELPLTEAERESAVKRIQRMINRREKAFGDIMNRYESPTNTAPGSLWAAFNAVTEFANHSMSYRGKLAKQAESRFQSILVGRADDVNQAAYSRAASLVLSS